METKTQRPMTRKTFIKFLFDFHNTELAENKATAYNDALTVGYSVDWNLLYLHYIKTYEKRFLPAPAEILAMLPMFKKIDLTLREDDGCELLIEYTDGRFTTETLASWCNCKSLKERINKCGNIKSVKKFPKNTTIMIGTGAKVYTIFFESDDPELEKQVKTIYEKN